MKRLQQTEVQVSIEGLINNKRPEERVFLLTVHCVCQHFTMTSRFSQ